MISRKWLFGIILVVPLIGFTVAEGIQAYFNAELRSVLRKQYPEAEPAAIEKINIDLLCENPDPELEEICITNTSLNFMIGGSLGAGVVGVVLLLVIRLAGTLARNNRTLLLYLFKPGLYITSLTLIGLILVHAIVAMGAIYYGESALIGRIHGGIILLIGFGAIAGIFVIARSFFSLLRTAQTQVIGTNLSRNEAPALWNQVERIADQLGALRPQHIVLGLDPNFFVTEADVICLDGNLSGRTLYCSLPLSRIISASELDAVIGHELGHFKGLDTKFSEKFYPIYRGTVSALDSLVTTGEDSAASIALLPAIAIFSYFLECFSVAESRISRERELAADQEGVNITDKATMAIALIKIHAFSGFWNSLREASAKVLNEGKMFVNASKTYAEVVVNNATPNALDGIAENHLSHPTDSHPPLGMRLESLGVTIKEVSEASLSVKPVNPAINLIAEFENKEEEISEVFQAILARQIGIDLNANIEN